MQGRDGGWASWPRPPKSLGKKLKIVKKEN